MTWPIAIVLVTLIIATVVLIVDKRDRLEDDS